MFRIATMCSAAALAAAVVSTSPAEALTMKECGTRYQAAKEANTLKGMKWNDFRKAECADDDVSAADAAKEVKDEKAKPSDPATTATKTSSDKTGSPKTTSTANVSFPTTVSDKYASETPGKARLHTCLDQYNANKTANGGSAPMRWIEKGGGYYSQCNAKLKS